MSRRLKKFGSSLGLGRRGEEGQDDQRNVTPPSSSIPVDDTLTTPTQQIIGTGPNTTPDDAIITTPPTTDQSPLAKPTLVQRILKPFKSPSGIHPAPEIIAQKPMHMQGVTGSDPTLPIFTGLSKDSHDHFIDIDTDSMETAPDVRSYFWAVGLDIQHNPVPPVDLEERRVFDAQLVRAGREYLKDLREQGAGWFMSPSRSLVEKNEPGTLWHRMPTAGIAADILEAEIEAMEDEGCFFDPDRQYDETIALTALVLTNLRVPLWWAESLKEGVVPGTRGWDEAVRGSYTDGFHPAQCMARGWDRDEMVVNIVRIESATPAGDSDELPVDRFKADQVLRRDWPDLELPYDRSQDEFIGPGYLHYTNSTIESFLGRTQ